MSREVVSVAMNLLDRYSALIVEKTSSTWICDGTLHAVFKLDFQLTSMGCLFIASKLYDSHHPMFQEKPSTLACLVHMTKSCFSEQQLAVKEKEILKTLYWKVHPPTPQVFVSLLALELKRSSLHQVVSAELEDLAAYLIELSVTDYFFVSFKPSEVALASLLYSLELRLFLPTTILNMLPHLLPFPLTPRVLACSNRLKSMYHDISIECGGRMGCSSAAADAAVPDMTPGSMASPVTVTMDLRNQTSAS
jgi:Cyclin, N-terminal domain/Cyclin, C-terminal domain